MKGRRERERREGEGEGEEREMREGEGRRDVENGNLFYSYSWLTIDSALPGNTLYKRVTFSCR